MAVIKPVSDPRNLAIRRALLAWFVQNKRPMPWRQKVSAYCTVVSELMCQQTRISTVIPYFERWIQKWPNFEQLAKAKESEVLAAWAGLGYYSRARNLHQLARQISKSRKLPKTASEWLRFKGIGRYTAAAISSIAFCEPVAAVDGNVVRVLTRLDGIRKEFRNTTTAAISFLSRANELVDPHKPGEFNQAMMELGATVCHKGKPDCLHCPISKWCNARAQGDAPNLPRFVPKVRQITIVDRALVQKREAILVRRNLHTAKRLAGMAEIPTIASLGIPKSGKLIWIRRRTIGTVTYQERLHSYKARDTDFQRWAIDSELEWLNVAGLDSAALSGPHRRWIQEWLNQDDRKELGKQP